MIFFDLDGTLIDHDYAVKKALIELLRKRKIKSIISEDELYKVWNENLEKYYDLYLEGKLTHTEQRIERMRSFYKSFNVLLSDEEVNESFSIYLNAYQENWCLYDDVLECLKFLSNKPIGIISNGFLDQQKQKLENTNIIDLFEIVVASSEIGVAKPNKEIFIYSLNEVNVNIEDCIYIGDRWETDALGSKNAGMKAIWLDRTNTYNGMRENIKVINSLKELIELV